MPTPTFVVENVMLTRETRHDCQEPGLALQITEYQDLFMQFDPVDRTRFRAFSRDTLTMITDNRLWYQFAVVSKEVEKQLEENKMLDWGSEATWHPEQLAGQDFVKKMTEIAGTVIEAIDNVGYHNTRPGTVLKTATTTETQQQFSSQQSSRHTDQSRRRDRNSQAGGHGGIDQGYWYDPARGPDMIE